MKIETREGSIDVRVYLAWWWTYLYVPTLIITAAIGIPPNWERVERDLTRALRTKIVIRKFRGLRA